MSFIRTLKREVRIATSRKAQPVWFRLLKWVIIVALVARYWQSPTFWMWMVAALAVALVLHLVWRTRTKGWTQPWGGWNDVEAGKVRDDE